MTFNIQRNQLSSGELNHLTIVFSMILFGGMQNFEASFQEFLTQVKNRFDAQNATLAEYEKFVEQVQQIFPTYQGFIHQLSDGLISVSQTVQNQSDAIEHLQKLANNTTASGSQATESEQAFRVQAALNEKNLRDQLARAEQALKDLQSQSVLSEERTRSSPASRKTAPSAKVQAAISSMASTEKKKILIVDDAEINRILMGHFFKNMPVTLEFAGSGEQALEKIAAHTFDLVIMDLQMKGMTGVEAIKAIRTAQPQNVKKTQIVAISNQTPTDEERKEAIGAGATEYLSKSMSRDAIKERVFEFLFGANQISA